MGRKESDGNPDMASMVVQDFDATGKESRRAVVEVTGWFRRGDAGRGHGDYNHIKPVKS